MTSVESTNVTKVLAVASGGGHWIQLSRLIPAWLNCDVAYVTTDDGYKENVIEQHKALGFSDNPRFYCVPDANRNQRIRLVWQLAKVILVCLLEKPRVVVSTGASAGYFAIRIGKLIGAKTIWVDSIANAETLSMAGSRVGPYADLWLTQWEHIAEVEADRVSGKSTLEYSGAVI